MKWFISKGYQYTKKGEILKVKAEDLMHKSKSMVKVVCDYCGEEYETEYSVYYNGHLRYPKDACKHCASKKTSDITRVKYAKQYFDKAKDICSRNGYILITEESEYVDAHMNVKYICPKHGIKEANIDNLARGHGCLECAYEQRGSYAKYTMDEVEEMVNSVNGNILLNKDEYSNCTTHNLNIECECGNVFTTSLVNYIKHGVNRCRACSYKESNGEHQIRRFLENHNIPFTQECRFDDCRDKRTLPFDFYLPNNNLIIEYDGPQHYHDGYFNNYKTTVKHDKIKNQFCKNKRIDILRIPFWDHDSIEEILSNKLNI